MSIFVPSIANPYSPPMAPNVQFGWRLFNRKRRDAETVQQQAVPLPPQTTTPARGLSRRDLLIRSGLVAAALALPTGCSIGKDPVDDEAMARIRDSLGTQILDKNKATLFEAGYMPVSLDKMPRSLLLAVLCTEDQRFFDHEGASLPDILRAIKTRHGGASTITQQVVKNLTGNDAQTLSRKWNEIRSAIATEKKLSKQEILYIYLNIIFYGNNVFDIGSASKLYFNKETDKLTLNEGALLAGLINAPTDNDPLKHPDAAESRRKKVLGNIQAFGPNVLEDMRRKGFFNGRDQEYETLRNEISAQNLKALRETPAKINKGSIAVNEAPYFNQRVLDEARDILEKTGKFKAESEDPYEQFMEFTHAGFKIYTTLDLATQHEAEADVRNVQNLKIPGIGYRYGTSPEEQVALVSMDTEGHTLAYVGGRDYKESQYNLAKAPRNPASTIKPFAQVTGLEQGVIGGTETDSIPYREAYNKLANSDNAFAQKLVARVGGSQAYNTARQMGLDGNIYRTDKQTDEKHLQDDPDTIALGLDNQFVTLENLTAAYNTIANPEGRYIPPVRILKITDRNGQELYNVNADPEHPSKPGVIIDPDTRAKIIRLLQGPIDAPHASAPVIKSNYQALRERELAGKTGTGDGGAFVGFTPTRSDKTLGITTGVTVTRRANGMSPDGGGVPAALWGTYMNALLTGNKNPELPKQEKLPEAYRDIESTFRIKTLEDFEAEAKPSPSESASSEPSAEPSPAETNTSAPQSPPPEDSNGPVTKPPSDGETPQTPHTSGSPESSGPVTKPPSDGETSQMRNHDQTLPVHFAARARFNRQA